jgi:P pilus assembly chaperone PapD
MHHHRQLTLAAFTVAAVAGASARPARAQGVLVAPHAVFIDHRTRSGWVQLHNPTSEPTEISVETIFGYPVTDSLGHFELRTLEQPDSALPSAVKWITAFPRRTVLQPLARQTIRLMVTPPPDLPDGEYWARLVITARGAAPPVTGADSAQGITVGLNLEVRTVIPVLYRKGSLATGITLSDLRTSLEADSVIVRSRLTRTGQAAFLGTVRGTLASPDGSVAGRFEEPVSVYLEVDPRFVIPRAGLKPGRYRLTIEVVGERRDIAAEQVLPITPARATIEVTIP